MNHHRSIAALTVLAIAAACGETVAPIIAPEGPSFIVNGIPSGGSFASVGALLFDFNQDGVITGDDQWCTGSLVAPTLFLTAAHCVVSQFTPPGTQFYVSFSPDLYAGSFTYLTATGYTFDPAFGHDLARLHDLALVFLPIGSTGGMTPLQLPPAGYLTGLGAKGGLNRQLFVNVGYGTSAALTGIPRFSYDGKRRTSKSEFMALQPTWLGLLMNSHATRLGGDCYGDSGGPKFVDGNTDLMVATVTTGDFPCRATTWDWRLDTPEARGFLGQYLTLP